MSSSIKRIKAASAGDEQRNGSVKLNGSRKERRWGTAAAVKRQKPVEEEKEEEVKDEVEENSFDLPNNMEHTQERLLQRTYSNKNKRDSVNSHDSL
ncbi:hypothetical protein QTP86_008683 [Hemibagrus guttatus]|nr:hypothetical protein QTP86_008683 [Hemibagrus guttatus]